MQSPGPDSTLFIADGHEDGLEAVEELQADAGRSVRRVLPIAGLRRASCRRTAAKLVAGLALAAAAFVVLVKPQSREGARRGSHAGRPSDALEAEEVKKGARAEDWKGRDLFHKVARGMLTIGDNEGGCFKHDTAYMPLDMGGLIPLEAADANDCQARCAEHDGCAHFSFDYVSKVCHLQDVAATMKRAQLTFIAGPRVCPATTTSTVTATMTTTTTVTQTETTRTTTETMLPATTTTTTPVLESLFCFLVLMPHGYEPDLVRLQVAKRVGVFSCNDHMAFSVAKMDLGSGIWTSVIRGVASKKGSWGSWLNTENFLQAWEGLIADGRFRRNAWTVKADADCVFFPDRLRVHLHKVLPAGTDTAMYIKNCPKDFGFMGSLEIISRQAVDLYGSSQELCRSRLNPESSGEDGFMQACMHLSGASSTEDFSLLIDGYCGHGTCDNNQWSVGFHPYKGADPWFKCWAQATAAGQPQ